MYLDNLYDKLHIPNCHMVRIYAINISLVLISVFLLEQCQTPVRSLSSRQELPPKVYT